MLSEYVQCLVCGKVTPVKKGICYHCNSPLPSKVEIPPGTIVCPNCLRVTPVDTGYCRRCLAPLPLELVKEHLSRKLELKMESIVDRVAIKPGPIGRVIRIGA